MSNVKYNNAGAVSNSDLHGAVPDVRSFGAERGRIVADAAISGTTLTSATANFTSNDHGMLVIILGAGTDGTYYGSTIASITSTSQVEMVDAAGTAVVDAVCAIGKDNTTAFNNACASSDNLLIPFGAWLLNGTVTIRPNQYIFGIGRGSVGDANAPSADFHTQGVNIFNATDNFCFQYLSPIGSASYGWITGMKFENLSIFAKNGIKINQEWADISSPELAGSDWDYQGHCLGPKFIHVTVTGEYNSDLDANYDTDTEPTFSELRGYGVGLHLSKCFDAVIDGCEWRQTGIGVIMTGSDYCRISTNRFANNARHHHATKVTISGVDVWGSGGNINHCDILVHNRVGGIYLDTTQHWMIKDNFFECSGDRAKYIHTDNDRWTHIDGNRFTVNTGGSGTTTPWIEIDPQWGMVISRNSWNVGPAGVPAAHATLGTTNWSSTLQNQVKFIDNDPEMPLPDAAFQRGPVDEYRLDYHHWHAEPSDDNIGSSRVMFGAATGTFPWEKSSITGRWVIQRSLSPSNPMIWRAPLKSPSHRKFLFEIWATKISAGGTVLISYNEDIDTCTADAGTDYITCASAHNKSDGEQVRLRTTATLPDPLSTGSSYYVLNATANTMQLEVTLGGGAIDLTDTGTGIHYLQHSDQFVNRNHAHQNTAKPDLDSQTIFLDTDRKGTGYLELYFDNEAAELQSVQITPITYEVSSSIPTDSNHNIGDRVWNSVPEEVEPIGWVYTNDSEWLPLARLGNGVGYSFVNSTPVTLDDDEHIIEVDSTVGDVTINLPPVSNRAGTWYLIQNLTGGNNVIITADTGGPDYINNETTFTLSETGRAAWVYCIASVYWRALQLSAEATDLWTETITGQQIGTKYQTLIQDDTDSNPMQLHIQGNDNASQGATPLLLLSKEVSGVKEDVAEIDETGAAEVETLLVDSQTDDQATFLNIRKSANASQSSTPLLDVESHLYVNGDGDFAGVGVSSAAGTEGFRVLPATRFDDDVEFANETGPAPVYIDGDEKIQASAGIDSNDILRWSGTQLLGFTYAELWNAMVAAIGTSQMRSDISAAVANHTHTGSVSGTTTSESPADPHDHDFSDSFTTSTES